MKKILIMSFGSDAGGIEKSLIEFLKYLNKYPLEIDLYLWREPGILYNQIPEGINIIDKKLYPGNITGIKNQKSILAKFEYLKWYMKFRIDQYKHQPINSFLDLEEYDVAISYCQNGYSPYYIIDKVCANKKYLWYHHGSYEKNEQERKRDLAYYKQYTDIITVSNSNKKMLQEKFPELEKEILVINNLLDEDKIKELAQKKLNIDVDNKTILVTVGRIAPEKGQLFAIEVARLLKLNSINFTWIFVGDGPENQECRNKIKEYELQEYCELVGEHLNPYMFLNKADIYIQSSSIESESITIKEALVLKKFIIASNISAVREVLLDGKYGELCELDIQVFSNTIIKHLHNKELRNMYLHNIENKKSNNYAAKVLIEELIIGDQL